MEGEIYRTKISQHPNPMITKSNEFPQNITFIIYKIVLIIQSQAVYKYLQ